MPFEIVMLETLEDNYTVLLHDVVTGQTAVVDAPDDPSIEAEIEARGWSLDAILLTHHHWDHIDGAQGLRERLGAKIIGAKADAHRLPDLDTAVSAGESFEFAGRKIDVIDVPGHTVGHIAYYIAEESLLFSADSLMALGCGRLFEGTPAQMYESLLGLASLPKDTLIYSGHEYSEANARFALTIEPGNPALQDRAKEIDAARKKGQPTVPATLQEELATNPYLRTHVPSLKAGLGMSENSALEVFTEIRKRKDNF